MNKLIIFAAFIIVMLLMIVPCGLSEAGKTEDTFRLPESLQIIGEGAFENTKASTIYINDNATTISTRAFANMPYLRDVYISDSVSFIADDAFADDYEYCIHGSLNSYAFWWAQIHGIWFVPIDEWIRSCDKQRNDMQQERVRQKDELTLGVIFPWNDYKDNIPLRKDKPELYPLDYSFP